MRASRQHLRTNPFSIPSAVYLTLVIWFGAVASGCRQPSTTVTREKPTIAESELDSRRPALNLSEYGLFRDMATQAPADGVVPYWLNATSYLDGAEPEFFVYIPEGQSARFRAEGPFEFPLGTVLIQNIRFPSSTDTSRRGHQLLETRLFIHKRYGWSGITYLWNDEQTEAQRAVIGAKTQVSRRDWHGNMETFTYHTPNMNDCSRCHTKDEQMVPIGVDARNLNRLVGTQGSQENQLTRWQRLGILVGLPSDPSSLPSLPDWRDEISASLDQRARCWLEVNCAYCHRPGGPAFVSGLDLSLDQTEPVRIGIYKPPVAAGRGSSGHRFSILPGEPEKSFLLHRIRSNELGVMMPPVGRATSDLEGAHLIADWISKIPIDTSLAEAALNPMAAYRKAIQAGNPERGQEIFFKVQQCINCHRVGDQGHSIGPNLSDVGSRLSAELLLESIVDPSAKVAEGFRTEVVITESGQVVTGIIQSEDAYELVIAEATNTHKILKKEIEERYSSDVSIMPTMANILTVEQVADVIAYLLTLRSPSVP